MSNERPEQFMMIGLHKLASQFGDGLVPELYELLSNRARMIEENPNVTEFPAWQSRLPARPLLGIAPEPQDNILSFPTAAAVAAPNKSRA